MELQKPLTSICTTLILVLSLAAPAIVTAQKFPTKPPIPVGPKSPQMHMRSLTNAQRKAAAVRGAQKRTAAVNQGKSVVPQRKGVKR